MTQSILRAIIRVVMRAELPSPVTLMRRGWTRDSLKLGDRVSVSGAPAKNFPAIAIANFVKDATGKPMFTGTTQVYEP